MPVVSVDPTVVYAVASAPVASLRNLIHLSFFQARWQYVVYGDFLDSPNNKGLRDET
jgi:hypothetical protein|tara:strand:- start:825 stop:995 length:171 start_codon:yes stop_codon:yes gene_type:complete